MTVTFDNVSTLFDTCQLGPDFNLDGDVRIASGHPQTNTFDVTVNLARLALAGPFLLTTPGGGLALGVAQFTPGDPAAAVQQCLSTGVDAASLSGTFSTLLPLAGSASP